MMNKIEQWSGDELTELKKVFYAGAYELVEKLQDELLALEEGHAHDRLTAIKRHLHTLKGDSNSVGLTSVGTLCHRMEDVVPSIEEPGASSHDAHDTVNLLLSCVDAVHALLTKSEAGEYADAGEMIDKIDRFLVKKSGASLFASPALSEYGELQAQEAVQKGLFVYDVDIVFHPGCGEKGVAARMVAQQLTGMGRIIHASPDMESDELDSAERMAVVFATDHDAGAVRGGATIAGMTGELVVRVHECAACETRPEGGDAATVSPFASKPGAQIQAPAAPSGGEFLRIEASRVDRIMNLTGELIIGRSMIGQMAREMAAGTFTGDGASRLLAAHAHLERTISDLQKSVMKMRMVPVNQVFRKFPKMVRDLSAEKKKPVRLEIIGKETELDKGIVDGLGEPLAHIVRNMIDHGIEGPAERTGLGKPAEGVITFRAYHEASMIVIEASDDGKGIDTGKLKQRAMEKGLLNREEAATMSDAAAVDLIFMAGLSTADEVTDTSGRGVGMDAVKSAVEDLRGTVELYSVPGRGTTIRLRLPLTLAVIKALLFEAGEQLYALPVSVIAEVAKVTTDSLVTVNGRKTLLLRDEIVSVISVRELFHPGAGGEDKKFVLVVEAGGRTIGLLVDRLVGQQELVIKAIDELSMRSRLVAGAALLGNGKIVMILDVLAVARKAVDEDRRGQASA